MGSKVATLVWASCMARGRSPLWACRAPQQPWPAGLRSSKPGALQHPDRGPIDIGQGRGHHAPGEKGSWTALGRGIDLVAGMHEVAWQVGQQSLSSFEVEQSKHAEVARQPARARALIQPDHAGKKAKPGQVHEQPAEDQPPQHLDRPWTPRRLGLERRSQRHLQRIHVHPGRAHRGARVAHQAIQLVLDEVRRDFQVARPALGPCRPARAALRTRPATARTLGRTSGTARSECRPACFHTRYPEVGETT